MRISTDETDPGYQTWADLMCQGAKVEVFLDGIKQNEVDTADDVQGYVRRAQVDAWGEYVLRRDNVVLLQHCKGRVQIIINEGA